MRQVYLSHSWQNQDVSEYLLDLLEPFDWTVTGDRESPYWGPPKIQRFIFNSDGLLAVVPWRESGEPHRPYSRYQEVEIRLALRANIPSLLFVDERIIPQFRQRNGAEVMPLRCDAPGADLSYHRDAVTRFYQALAASPSRESQSRERSLREVVIVVGQPEPTGLEEVLALLQDAERTYRPRVFSASELTEDYLDSPLLHRALLSAECAVFFLPVGYSIARGLADLAEVLRLPRFRLCRIPGEKPGPRLDGTIVYDTPRELGLHFVTQLDDYRLGMVQTFVPRASRPVHEWSPKNPLALIRFIRVGSRLVTGLVRQVHAQLPPRGKRSVGVADLIAAGRLDVLCEATYRALANLKWMYDYERGSSDYSAQIVRSPDDLFQDGRGCCLDLVSIYTALLEAMQANPVVIWLQGEGQHGLWAHALAGCWVRGERRMPLLRSLEEIRRAVRDKELVLVETTGAVKAFSPVTIESAQMRAKSDGFLEFRDAVAKARALLASSSVRNAFLIDVKAARKA